MKFPGIDVKKLLQSMELAASKKRVECCYCNAENFSDEEIFVCYNCELANTDTAREARRSDQALAVRLSRVDSFLAKKDYGGAEFEYENIARTYKDPETLYSTALLNVKCSNAERAAVRYDRQGFMEENSAHIENASKRKSKAALYLNRAAVLCENEFKTGIRVPERIFTFFMLNIKLDNLKTARRAIGMLELSGNLQLARYARMVFSAEQLKPEETAIASMELVRRSPSASALYYLAWALFKVKRYKESMQLLSGIRKYIDTGNIDALMYNIEKAKEV